MHKESLLPRGMSGFLLVFPVISLKRLLCTTLYGPNLATSYTEFNARDSGFTCLPKEVTLMS